MYNYLSKTFVYVQLLSRYNNTLTNFQQIRKYVFSKKLRPNALVMIIVKYSSQTMLWQDKNIGYGLLVRDDNGSNLRGVPP